MPRHITIAFPGQGSHFLGMLNHFQDDLIQNLKDDVSKSLGFNIREVVTEISEVYKTSDDSDKKAAELFASEFRDLGERSPICGLDGHQVAQ